MGEMEQRATSLKGPFSSATRKLLSVSTNEENVTTTFPVAGNLTIDEAVALYREVEAFQKEYKMAKYKVPEYASPKEIELAMIRGTLNLRAREISIALFHNFVAYPTPTGSLPATDPTTILLRDYRSSLVSVNAKWADLLAEKLSRRQESKALRRRHKRRNRRFLHSQLAWWRAVREEAKEMKYDADVEEDDCPETHRAARRTAEKRERRKRYYARKNEMRRNGCVLTKALGDIERICNSPASSDGVPLHDSFQRNYIIPEHVKSDADLLVYFNQLGLRFTPCKGTHLHR
ncbi:uncharacterized protein CTRU02_213977 [Colletotrichum truncatum]|uniref:Uncharacterized protein n=1 Tax=Colletotrichum truncatum TaxID=5467 RepID=A0ACC3YHC7_COLTU